MRPSALRATRQRRTLTALCLLSNVSPTVALTELIERIVHAPDPETATRTVFTRISIQSPALAQKWRQVIWDTWAGYHPNIPLLPHVRLSSEDVATVPILRDAHSYLQAIEQQPAQLVDEAKERMLGGPDVSRLFAALPS